MRKTKSLLALLCAVVAAFVLAVPAFAADGSYTITINSKTSGHNYEAYQIFSGTLDTAEDTLVGIEWGDGINGEQLLIALKAEGQENPFNGYTGGNPFVAAKTAADVAKVLEGFAPTWVDTFAEIAEASLTEAMSGSQQGPTGTGPYVYTIKGVASGYYLVKDQDGSLADMENAYTKFILQVVHDVTVDAKADQPPIDKSITGVTGRDDEFSLDNIDAAIGDSVKFTLTSRVPEMDGYNYYKFVVTDTLSKGLAVPAEFDADDVSITFSKSGEQPYTVPAEDYTVRTDQAEDATTITIVFKNFIQYRETYKNWDITIVYSATVDQDAVIGVDGNPNTAKLEYSNDPNFIYDDDSDEFGDEPKGITPDSEVKVFVTGLEIIKTDENGDPLEGAEFTLSGIALNTVLVTRGEFQQDNENGKYYLLKDETYTTQAPKPDTEEKYKDTDTKYKLVQVTMPIVKKEQVEYKGYVDSNGVVRFDGLKAGTYTLEESVVPDGYNGIKPIQITVTFTAPSDSAGASWTFASDTAQFFDKGVAGGGAASGIYQTTIKNLSGATLPSTGGIGTTIFYAVGATLVIGAGVVLVSRYRANHMK